MFVTLHPSLLTPTPPPSPPPKLLPCMGFLVQNNTTRGSSIEAVHNYSHDYSRGYSQCWNICGTSVLSRLPTVKLYEVDSFQTRQSLHRFYDYFLLYSLIRKLASVYLYLMNFTIFIY